MKRMRLCFVLPSVWPLVRGTMDKTGGAEINLLNLARRFAEDPAYAVTFMVGDYGQEFSVTSEGIRFLKIRCYNRDREEWDRIPVKIWRELHFFFLLLSARQDIFLTSCGGGILGRIALARAVRCFQLVFRFANDFDTDPAYLVEHGEPGVNRLYLYGLKHADRLIAQTDLQKALLRSRMGYSADVIRNGFEIRKPERLPEKRHILWVASSSPVKRPELFLRLAERMPERAFVMIMPGTGESAEEIRRRARGIANLTLIPGVPFAKIQNWYDRAEWFVNTSQFEGFPNSFLQAGLGMTPVLSFLINPDGVVDKGGIGRMCDDDVEMAVRILETEHPDSMRRMGRTGLEYVASVHDIRGKKEQYDVLFRELLERRGR